MKLSNKYKKIYFPLIILLLLTLSCNMPIIGSRIDRQVSEDITNFNPFEQAGQQTNSDNIGNREYISIQISEAELTSVLNQELEKNPEFGFTNASVTLRDGLIQITGQENRSGFNLPIELNILLLIDDESHLTYKISSARLGPLPMPDYLVNQVSNQIEQVIANIYNFDRRDIAVEEITVDNGILSINGYFET